MLRASAEPAKRAAEKLVPRPLPSELIKQIAQKRHVPGFNPPQVSIGDILRYLDEVGR